MSFEHVSAFLDLLRKDEVLEDCVFFGGTTTSLERYVIVRISQGAQETRLTGFGQGERVSFATTIVGATAEQCSRLADRVRKAVHGEMLQVEGSITSLIRLVDSSFIDFDRNARPQAFYIVNIFHIDINPIYKGVEKEHG